MRRAALGRSRYIIYYKLGQPDVLIGHQAVGFAALLEAGKRRDQMLVPVEIVRPRLV